jgi:hypothetical protein
MFYQFKPAKTGDMTRSNSRTTPARSRLDIGPLTKKIRAFISRYPGIGKLVTVVALAVIGAVLAGMLFYQGVFQAQPTAFKIDLSKTFLGDSITAHQGLAKQSALDLYLDSLDKAITADSIRNLEKKEILSFPPPACLAIPDLYILGLGRQEPKIRASGDRQLGFTTKPSRCFTERGTGDGQMAIL